MTSFSSTQSLKKSLFKVYFWFPRLFSVYVQVDSVKADPGSSVFFLAIWHATASLFFSSLSFLPILAFSFFPRQLSKSLSSLTTNFCNEDYSNTFCMCFLWMYVPIMLKLQPYSFLWYIVYWKGQMVRKSETNTVLSTFMSTLDFFQWFWSFLPTLCPWAM